MYSIAYGEAEAGESVPRRNVIKKELVTNPAGCNTLYESFKRVSESCADKPCLGDRETLEVVKKDRIINGEAKPWTYYKRGPYTWNTFQEVYDMVSQFASGLRAIGINPKEKLAIYEETCFQWTIAEQACYSQSIIVLTVYANLGMEALSYALSSAKVEYVFASATLLSQLVKIKDKCHLTHVIYNGPLADEESANSLKQHGITLISYKEVFELGAKESYEATPPTPDDLACIMYTSGSTGLPKGVMMTHANMIAAVGGFGACFGVVDGDCYLNYLPLAHVLAMVVENAVLHYGAKMGFGNPKTLTEENMVDGCLGDLRELAPTAFAGVPLVYDRIKAGILKKVGKESFLKRTIFHIAIKIKMAAWKRGKSTPLLNKVVFDQFKTALGGNMRWMVSGGAPISATAHSFLTACFGVPLLQGYGLTESCGAGTVMQMDDHAQGTVGPPVPCVEIKLVDVEAMGYLTSNNPPQGEVWLRGPCITKGYYLNDEKTAEVYTSDGWFKTGDVGTWNPDGTLSIVDRVKNLVKNPYGEYIALEKLEAIYKNSNYVLNACVYASSDVPRIIAIVQPQPTALEGREADITKDKAFAEEIKKDLIAVGLKNGLKKFELVTDVLVVAEDWSPLNSMLTAAMKLNRRTIYTKYSARTESLLKN
eukprot:CAMPEP_0117046374 /NCGR_PEP_ID=MMETSP0472-20121206/32067_1 /TAXON_ID=693140 ORGANISM="Tiarina fusus, Strain LIS" /NCGR_SAMPLE_ID=MMETSP0472 /ASSEMBLY_ACC=CAM_ASM_000603 /LENGTH=650 /DNA_ID=CAMNT_0004758705 /DNA_START=75 /DNA_END=2027 /DNA_ORIENTATION=+